MAQPLLLVMFSKPNNLCLLGAVVPVQKHRAKILRRKQSLAPYARAPRIIFVIPKSLKFKDWNFLSVFPVKNAPARARDERYEMISNAMDIKSLNSS